MFGGVSGAGVAVDGAANTYLKMYVKISFIIFHGHGLQINKKKSDGGDGEKIVGLNYKIKV